MAETTYETLAFELRDGVARVTLNRPEAANALDLQMSRELMAAAIRCDEERAVRAVLLEARGKLFCAGGDLQSFAGAGEGMPALIKEMTSYLHAAVSRFARMRAPLITAVGGPAAGAGMSLACSGDLVLASSRARFTLAYTKVGLAPDGSSSFVLPRLVGARRTLDLMLTNRTLSAEEAEAWGLVSRVVPAESLAAEAESLAAELASGPTEAYGLAKALVSDSLQHGLETQMERESRAIAAAARTADAREGVAAFLAKRAPTFKGE